MDLLAQLGLADPRPPLPVDRSAVESWLGLRLPSDYWESARRGSLLIGGAIELHAPDRAYLGMLPWTKHDVRTELRGAGRVPPPLHPAPGGLLPWGHTLGGRTFLLWNTADPEPDRWTVVLCDATRPEPLLDSGLGLTAFLETVVLDRVGHLGPLPATAQPQWATPEPWSPPPTRELSPAESEFALHGPAGLPALRLLVPPPRSAPRPVDRERSFALLGTRLPADYLALADAYGAGTWSEWLSLYAPEDLAGLPERIGRSVPGPCWPEPDGFLAVGCTIDNDRLGWLVTGPDPDAWTLVVRPRHVRGEVPLAGRLVEVLLGWLRGERGAEGLPALDPDDDPFECAGFEPWPADSVDPRLV
ncbi:hypothetical protein [Streptomyces sp. TLI_171]|uniref:hypothetical protein n=1 Tax=Streptomyces sp. TLI_171 TaxID=1938859 RepID=UPI001180A58C|nr:hypothetical protein [Streptomyces sp. TLI_171]